MPMNALRPLAVAAALAAFCTAASAQLEGMKGKMKEGLYEYKVEVDMGSMPGMPPGMGKQTHTVQNCVTAKDIESGSFAQERKGGNENCKVSDQKMSGNTASYVLECKGETQMRVDAKMTFADNAFTMENDMQMNQGGQAMKMKQKIQARHIGPCKK
jgi:hypothetical protein